MEKLVKQMNQVWWYIKYNQDATTAQIVTAFANQWEAWHTYMLLEALLTDGYLGRRGAESLKGGSYYWTKRDFTNGS